jgi:hypothetical protein
LGFTLAPASASAPTGVRVEDPAIGGTLKLSWTNPTGAFDHIHIYRSTDPSQLGTLVHDSVSGPPLWDTGVLDGTKYRYTVCSVAGGVESTNTDYYYGIASGGLVSNTYSQYPGAVWGHWHNDYGQTFVATRTGSIGSASCTPGFGGGGGTNLTFSIHQGGPGGAQIGPSASKWASGDGECTVTWNQGEVPVQAGQTYYLRVTGSSGFAAYRGGDTYSQGCFYIGGVAQTGSDMWSTITVVEAKSVLITDISAGESPAGTCTFSWKTTGPSTSQVEYGTSESYGSLSALGGTLVTDHTAVVAGLDTDTIYHFRVRSTRPGLPAPGQPSTIALAKSQPDGTPVQLAEKTVTVGNDRFSGQFYIQDADRTSGIRVMVGSSGISVHEGDIINVSGTMATMYGERQITNPSATIISSGNQVPRPLSMINREVGGGSLNEYTPGVHDGLGANNTGLLVQIWGRATHADAVAKFFYLDDGSHRLDGSGYVGLKVSCGGLTTGNTIIIPPAGSYVRVTGISTKQSMSGYYIPLIRPRVQGDIEIME